MKKDNNKIAVDIFDSYAQSYQTKYMNVEKYHPSLNLFCTALPNEKASILELACGPGNNTKYLLTGKSELQILATDLSPAMLKLAKENNPGIKTQLLDCRSVLQLQSKFDAVMCGFGLPYINKEEAITLIKDVSTILHKDGLLYLSTMEDDYIKSGYKTSSSNPNEGLFIYFHEAGYLIQTMESNGFKIIEVSRVKYLDPKGENVTDLILIGKL